jgi:hypothetical protein
VQLRKLFPQKIEERLKLKINVIPNFTKMETGHGNITSYLFKYKIKDSPTCSCKRGEQTIDHIIFVCELVEKERKRQTKSRSTAVGKLARKHRYTYQQI